MIRKNFADYAVKMNLFFIALVRFYCFSSQLKNILIKYRCRLLLCASAAECFQTVRAATEIVGIVGR